MWYVLNQLSNGTWINMTRGYPYPTKQKAEAFAQKVLRRHPSAKVRIEFMEQSQRSPVWNVFRKHEDGETWTCYPRQFSSREQAKSFVLWVWQSNMHPTGKFRIVMVRR